jgi:capsule polysaccharide export protein KpsC/LpsZ
MKLKLILNTYDLIKSATAVLCYSSTSGVEALMLNKAVLAATNCYYSKIGICSYRRTEREYFEELHQLTVKSIANNKEPRRAELVYFVAQVLNWHKTNFTPNSQDMARWISYVGDDFEADPNVRVVLDSITSGTPLSTLRYQRNLY